MSGEEATRPTFAHFDLDVGVALCDIFDAPNDFRHLGAGRGEGLAIRSDALRCCSVMWRRKKGEQVMSQAPSWSWRCCASAVGGRGGSLATSERAARHWNPGM